MQPAHAGIVNAICSKLDAMLKGIRISLANKCQLLFGLAVLLVMAAALTVVALRMQALVDRGPERRARDLSLIHI